jgi:cold shock CspA family protein/ribosome-associated translation inhibitor RaiA
MQRPLQISFRDMPPSEAVERSIREHADRFECFHARITGCRVMIESHHRHHRQGKLYHVRIDLTVPGGEIVVGRDPAEHHAHEDVYVAIRDAFDAARRRLEDHARRWRGDTKTHQVPGHGRIVRLVVEDGYGFIATPDGEEVYFHRNSLTEGDFDHLRVGVEVRYTLHEGEGEQGPQASAVTPIGKHRLPPTETV